MGENYDTYGYMPAKFVFPKGSKLMLGNGKFVISAMTIELGDEAFYLFKREFSEYKNDRSLSIMEKVKRLCDFACRYSGIEGNEKAARLAKAYEDKFSDCIEKLMSSIEAQINQ